jgi:GH15 family glucan-1,4-alpha-glucosidase
VGDFLLRYSHRDDFGETTNAFTVCSFWWANALAGTGQMDAARALFKRLLAVRNCVGLLSEHVDPRTGTLWGNFPQTYSMVGIITTAMRLSKRWEDEV